MSAQNQHANVFELPETRSPGRPANVREDDHLTRRHYAYAVDALEDARRALADVRAAFTGALVVVDEDVLFRLRRAEQLVEASQVACVRAAEGRQP